MIAIAMNGNERQRRDLVDELEARARGEYSAEKPKIVISSPDEFNAIMAKRGR